MKRLSMLTQEFFGSLGVQGLDSDSNRYLLPKTRFNGFGLSVVSFNWRCQPPELLLSRFFLLALLSVSLVATSCRSATLAAPPTALAPELRLYDWPDDIPVAVLAQFTAEYGVQINYETYGDQKKAVEELAEGAVYDVVVMSNEYVYELIQKQLLAPIDYQVVTNFKNISPNFRDLAYDPQNRYSIPFNWGTVGIIVRTDIITQPITQWQDLWDPAHAGQIIVWQTRREMIGAVLKSLNYSCNSEDPNELEEARQRLLALRPHIRLLAETEASVAPYLVSGEAPLALGFARDVLEAQKSNPAVQYVLPTEGTMLWGDNFVIPANSPNQRTAQLFLNFLLRPEIGAQIFAHNLYPTVNDAAKPLLDPALRNDPVIFPSTAALQNAEILLAVSPETMRKHEEIWQEFLSASQ